MVETNIDQVLHTLPDISIRRGTDSGPRVGRCQGIDVACTVGPAYFGKGFPRREVDWLVRRINRFLGYAKDDDAPEPAVR